MTTHRIDIDTAYVDPVLSRRKPFEVRRNDRAYQPGDYLLMREVGRPDSDDQHWVESESERDCFRCRVRRFVRARVTFVYSGDPRWGGLEPGYVVLGLEGIGLSLPLGRSALGVDRG